jgi:hypothetical protein
MGDIQEINSKGFFKKLSNGDFGLAKTYWLYGVLVGIVSNILMLGATPTMALLLVLVMIVYAAFQLTGVWNASNRYTGLKIWAILAKIAVVISILSLLSSILMVVGMGA